MSAAEPRTDGLDESLVDGQVWQIASLQGVFVNDEGVVYNWRWEFADERDTEST